MVKKAVVSTILILMIATLSTSVALASSGGNGGSVIAGPGSGNNGGAHAGNGANGGAGGAASSNGGDTTYGSASNSGAGAVGSRFSFWEMLKVRFFR